MHISLQNYQQLAATDVITSKKLKNGIRNKICNIQQIFLAEIIYKNTPSRYFGHAILYIIDSTAVVVCVLLNVIYEMEFTLFDFFFFLKLTHK